MRAAGISSRKARAASRARAAEAARPQRHPQAAAVQPESSRPPIPPMLLPATYRPIAEASALGWISSAR